MVDFGGWDMPLAYRSGTIDEHIAFVTAAMRPIAAELGLRTQADAA